VRSEENGARFVRLSLAFALSAAAVAAIADDFPARPIRIVVPWPAGGPPDAVGRLLGARLADAFKQQVVIDNRPGANSIIGTDIVAKAPPAEIAA